jgi:hypothetical protein
VYFAIYSRITGVTSSWLQDKNQFGFQIAVNRFPCWAQDCIMRVHTFVGAEEVDAEEVEELVFLREMIMMKTVYSVTPLRRPSVPLEQGLEN